MLTTYLTKIFFFFKYKIAVYVFHTHVTLKHGQHQQTWYDSADPKQGYNHAMFGRPCFNSVHAKTKVKVLYKLGNA